VGWDQLKHVPAYLDRFLVPPRRAARAGAAAARLGSWGRRPAQAVVDRAAKAGVGHGAKAMPPPGPANRSASRKVWNSRAAASTRSPVSDRVSLPGPGRSRQEPHPVQPWLRPAGPAPTGRNARQAGRVRLACRLLRPRQASCPAPPPAPRPAGHRDEEGWVRGRLSGWSIPAPRHRGHRQGWQRCGPPAPPPHDRPAWARPGRRGWPKARRQDRRTPEAGHVRGDARARGRRLSATRPSPGARPRLRSPEAPASAAPARRPEPGHAPGG
jgi:hypothetical protein